MRLPRSTPVRLAFAFLSLFVIGSLVANLIALRVIDGELLASEERRILERYRRLAALLSEKGAAALVEDIGVAGPRPDPDVGAAALVSAEGRVLAARPAVLAALASDLPDGWSTRPPAPGWPDREHGVKFLVGRVDGYRIAVGESLADRDEVAEVVVYAFGWSTLVLFVLTGGGAAFIASGFRRRFDAVVETMRSVADGALDARVACSPRGDDIDEFGADINEALERLQRSVAQVGRASADIAHDLRTPLGRLRITIEKALDAQTDDGPADGPADGSGRALLEQALDECDGIAATFAALLRIASLEARARRSNFVPVDRDALTARIVDLYEDVALDAGRELVPPGAEDDAPGLTVEGDPELLLQAMANLVENALQHAPPGTRIACGSVIEEGRVVASVADDGPGVPAAERDNVLRRLYRLDSSRTSPGSGLGLSLVKAIADLHGAELALEDNRPGLRIAIRFPENATRSRRPAAGRSHGASGGSPSALSPIRNR